VTRLAFLKPNGSQANIALTTCVLVSGVPTDCETCRGDSGDIAKKDPVQTVNAKHIIHQSN